MDALNESGEWAAKYLLKHQCGEWSDLGEADKRENELSLEQNARILSAYVLANGQRIYIITEWDRLVTTILLCSEY
jgi:hypothetical protein